MEVKFDAVGEEKQATALRQLCEMHIVAHPNEPLESKEFVKRQDVVKRWAEQRAHWNIEQGGLTLAELWFLALCYQQMAEFPSDLALEPIDLIDLYNHLKTWCRRSAGAPGIDSAIFNQVAYAVVYLLSHGIDEMVGFAADQHLEKQDTKDTSKKKRAARRQLSDGIAGTAVYGFIPMASRVFWCAWADEMVCHSAEDYKFDEKEFGQFEGWMKKQFAMPTQQAFRIALTELFYKDQVPTGGHTFHQRGSSAVGDNPPAFGLVQMELTEDEQKTLGKALDSTIPDMMDPQSPCRAMALCHMYAYTFGNRLQKGDLVMPFGPFIVHKWEIPDRLAELTGPLTQWGRPRRPIIVRTQTQTFVQTVECTCQPHTADHRDTPTSCVLKRKLYQCPDVMHALFLWHSLVRGAFKDTLACSTSLAKLSNEVFGT